MKNLKKPEKVSLKKHTIVRLNTGQGRPSFNDVPTTNNNDTTVTTSLITVTHVAIY